MNIDNFINENNVVQKYNINFISNNLKDYTDMTLNTIFYCKEDFDFKLLDLHQGKLYLYIDNINQFNRIQDKSKISIFLCNDINIYSF